ncbi:hypothetical protein [Halolamina salifodinae]|uniref:Uncharacterized protein n=1 Tax=Halolamina salifodinae TaxID=1202767 RepID=A0A8T4GWF7_9EURY|nr:hypothetical protein [Halolamina salifodinae]MBP1987246.1 hypothetical protein [Halolamina salifodinae]
MRHPTTVLLFIVCVAAVAGAMAASGTAGWLGVDDPSVGVEDQVNQSEGELHDYSASRQGGDTSFIGATISGTDEVISSFVVIFALSDMMVNAGLPVWSAVMLSSPLAWCFGLFIIYMFSGRSEVRPR